MQVRLFSDLPLNGRTFISLVELAPGVALPPASFFPRINGGRPRTNEYLFDGISVLQPEPGQVAFFPIIDAINFRRVGNESDDQDQFEALSASIESEVENEFS